MIYVTQQDKKMLKNIKISEINEHFKVEIQGDDIEFQITNTKEVWNWTRPKLRDEHLEDTILVPTFILKEDGDTKIEPNGDDLDITNKIGTINVKAADVCYWPDMFNEIDNHTIVWRRELSFDVLNKLVVAMYKNKDKIGSKKALENLLVTDEGLAATDGHKLYWHSDDYGVSDFKDNFAFHLPVTWRKKVLQKSKTLDAVRVEVERKCEDTGVKKENTRKEHYEITTMKFDDCVLDCMVKALDCNVPNIKQVIPQEQKNVLVFSDSDIESMTAALKNKYDTFVLTLDGTMTYKTETGPDGHKRRWEGSEITQPIALSVEKISEATGMGCKEFWYKDCSSPVKAQGQDGINVVMMPKKLE